MEYTTLHSVDLHNLITSPTCDDLGIPREQDTSGAGLVPSPYYPEHQHRIHAGHMKFARAHGQDPFSPFCTIPLPHHFGGYDYGGEPAFIRKRNERERERVRCVNEGYSRLREHIPIDNKDKRISKVETLRCTIKYIRHLQTLLSENPGKRSASEMNDADDKKDNENIDLKPAKRRTINKKSS